MSKKTLSVASPAALPTDYPRSAISETVSGKFGLAELAKVFTLPWSAYALLLSVKDGVPCRKAQSGRHKERRQQRQAGLDLRQFPCHAPSPLISA